MKTKVQQYVEGVGGIRLWGFSPSEDLSNMVDGSKDDVLNILSMMPGDICSFLMTIARRHTKKTQQINYYIVERQPEALARYILLLSIFFDDDLGPRECTEIFLEIYGNNMLRKQTSAFLHSKVEELIKFLTNGEGKLAEFVDITQMKFKERDAIEKVFKTWYENIECNMEEWREKRLRSYYEDRFDYRKNLIDWDYSMNVKDWAEIIHSKLFLWWRQEGIAYEIRDSKYPQPNRTMASYAEGKEKGHSKLKRGYWGDIVQSPYWSIGVHADEQSLYKKRSFQHTKTCQHVAEYNIYSLLFELSAKKRYKMPQEDSEIHGRSFWSGLSHRDVEKVEEEGEIESLQDDRMDTLSTGRAPESGTKRVPQGIKLVLLQGESLEFMRGKKKYAELFHLVFLSNLCLQMLKEPLPELLHER
mmetsp:Transcript_3332/g.11495  ORF Transcript_3332/g.11495 Transcript_3332/m.11495 type:complete len:416 (-) Transcript_3332:1010-2257(-)